MTDDPIHADDKETFIKTLNKKGFLLEDKTWKIINDNFPGVPLVRSKVIHHNNERVEIDTIAIIKSKHLVIECKRTDYCWIFPKAIQRTDVINLLFDSNGIKVKSRETSDFKTTSFDIAVGFDEQGRLKMQDREFARTSYKDIHDNIKQVLKEVEAYLTTGRFPKEMIIPIIVTNAPLFQLIYSKSNLNSHGDLTDYEKLEQVPDIVYNFPEIMKWDNGKQIVKNTNEFSEDHTKSIFIVNVNHLESFIRIILDQDL